MTDKGRLFIVSGFSGAGKGTIMNGFMEKYDGFVLSVSDTTREMRKGEIPGVHYNFVTKEEFERNINNGRMIEYTSYQDNYYGTPKSFVIDNLDRGNDVFLEIEVDGCGKVKKIFPEAVTVFVITPSAYELKRRLEHRGSDSREKILSRMKRAYEEMEFIGDYDYLLVNDDLEESIAKLYDITRGEYEEDPECRGLLERFALELEDIIKEEV